MRGPEWLKKAVKKSLTLARTPFSSEKIDTSQEAASAALERLHKVYPDVGSSCIRQKPLSISSNPKWDLDVIVPVYNAERFIRPCLDSILSQKTNYNYRVICVDDGSPDQCGCILDEEYADRPNVLVIHQENRGHSGARNRALDELDSRYLTFVDSDDVLPSDDVFELMLSNCLKNNFDLICGGMDRIDEEGKSLSYISYGSGIKTEKNVIPGFTCGKVILSAIFADIVFPDEYWFEDSLMRQIVFERVDKVLFIDKSVYQYRFNRQSISNTHQGNLKTIDALYVTLSLWRDRKIFGFSDDDAYQEYLLHMARLIKMRVRGLADPVKRDVFTAYSAWYSSIYGGSEPKKNKLLHEALLSGDYGRYLVYFS